MPPGSASESTPSMVAQNSEYVPPHLRAIRQRDLVESAATADHNKPVTAEQKANNLAVHSVEEKDAVVVDPELMASLPPHARAMLLNKPAGFMAWHRNKIQTGSNPLVSSISTPEDKQRTANVDVTSGIPQLVDPLANTILDPATFARDKGKGRYVDSEGDDSEDETDAGLSTLLSREGKNCESDDDSEEEYTNYSARQSDEDGAEWILPVYDNLNTAKPASSTQKSLTQYSSAQNTSTRNASAQNNLMKNTGPVSSSHPPLPYGQQLRFSSNRAREVRANRHRHWQEPDYSNVDPANLHTAPISGAVFPTASLPLPEGHQQVWDAEAHRKAQRDRPHHPRRLPVLAILNKKVPPSFKDYGMRAKERSDIFYERFRKLAHHEMKTGGLMHDYIEQKRLEQQARGGGEISLDRAINQLLEQAQEEGYFDGSRNSRSNRLPHVTDFFTRFNTRSEASRQKVQQQALQPGVELRGIELTGVPSWADCSFILKTMENSGNVESVSIYGSENRALVRFVHPYSASVIMDRHAETGVVIKPCEDYPDGYTLMPSLFPVHGMELDLKTLVKSGATRVVLILKWQRENLEELLEKFDFTKHIGRRWKYVRLFNAIAELWALEQDIDIVDCAYDEFLECRVARIVFAGIKEACDCRANLATAGMDGVTIDFGRDPCAPPVEEDNNNPNGADPRYLPQIVNEFAVHALPDLPKATAINGYRPPEQQFSAEDEVTQHSRHTRVKPEGEERRGQTMFDNRGGGFRAFDGGRGQSFRDQRGNRYRAQNDVPRHRMNEPLLLTGK